ncbi:MAG: chorismate mutase [Chloroflexota bacterium]
MSVNGTVHKERWPVCRGVRGATTCGENTEEAILAATRELLFTMIQANDIATEDVASAHFTTTMDLNATYPALAARQLGWYDAALLCGHEMDVPGGLPRCIRILIHWNTTKEVEEIKHVYLREARGLRPDRDTLPPVPQEELEQAMAQGLALRAGKAR